MFSTPRHLLTKNLALVTLVLVVLFGFSSTVLAQAPAGTADPGTLLGNGLQSFLWILVNGVFGWIVWAGGLLLNAGVNDFVIGFGDFYIEKGLGSQIDSLWIVVRDIFNLTFIFGLVGIGLRMIFNSNDSSTRKMLISLIMAALLVNFSLFITKFVVDFSNIATVQLVGAFPQTGGEPDVSGHFMQLMGLKGIFNMGGSFTPEAYTAGGGLGYIFGTMILYIVAGFVFFAGGILLLIRFAVLNIYMVLSPLMFIGWVFPSAAGITSQYWKGFLGRAFFAPAYILMLYFAQKILSSFSAGGTSTSLGEMFKPGAGIKFEEVVPPFVLTAIFLIASIVVAQKMGANGASGFVSMGQNLAGRAKNIALSPARKAARLTSGTAAVYAEKANNYLQTTRAGRNLKRVVSVASLGTFTERDRLAAIEAGKKAKFGGTYSYQDDQDFDKNTQIRTSQLENEKKRTQAFAASEKALADTTTSVADLTKALEDMGITLQSMTKDEKAKLGVSKLKNVHVAANLSDDDIEHFDKSGKFSTQEIQDIKDSRKTALTSIAAGGNTFANIGAGGLVTYSHISAPLIERRHKIASQGTQNIGKMPVSVFTQKDMYKFLTPTMVEERIKKGVTPTEKAQMRAALEKYLGLASGALPSTLSTPASKTWTNWETSNSFHASDFFT